jgi:hypothetical protein
MKVVCAILYLLLIALPMQSSAQSQKSVEKLQADITQKGDDLLAIHQNLIDMLAGGLSGDTKTSELLSEALHSMNEFYDSLNAFDTIASLYVGMLDVRDVNYVKKYLLRNCLSLIKTNERHKARINRVLPKLSNDAVRLEITRARDLSTSITAALFCQ